MIRFILAVTLFAPLAAGAQGHLNLYCSSPNTAWCQGMAVGFEKATGTRVAVVQKATGEMFAQIRAEAANPRGDIWWAGPADAYLQAAEEGLLDEYRSPNDAQLYDWAQRIGTLSKGRVSGVYGGIIALGYNSEVMARKKLPIPKVLERPRQSGLQGRADAGQSEFVGHRVPDAGDARADLRRRRGVPLLAAPCNPNVNQYARSGIGPMTAVKHGEIGDRQHRPARRHQRDRARLPGRAGAALRRRRLRGGIGGDHQGHAQPRRRAPLRRLCAVARRQRVGLDVKEYAIPTNRSVALPPQVPPLTSIKVIDYDFAKYGSSAERKRLLERWEKEINSTTR